MIMSKFKVGDKVRCVSKSSAFGVKVGEIYTVMNPQCFKSTIYEGVYCMELLEVGSSPYDKHFELVQEGAVLAPEEVFKHLRKGTKLEYRRTTYGTWSSTSAGLSISVNPTYKMITEGQWRIKPEPEVIELNGKKYREITE